MVLPGRCCTEVRVRSLAVQTRRTLAGVDLREGRHTLASLPSLREILENILVVKIFRDNFVLLQSICPTTG